MRSTMDHFLCMRDWLERIEIEKRDARQHCAHTEPSSLYSTSKHDKPADAVKTKWITTEKLQLLGLRMRIYQKSFRSHERRSHIGAPSRKTIYFNAWIHSGAPFLRYNQQAHSPSLPGRLWQRRRFYSKCVNCAKCSGNLSVTRNQSSCDGNLTESRALLHHFYRTETQQTVPREHIRLICEDVILFDTAREECGCVRSIRSCLRSTELFIESSIRTSI